jgi:hypothetical protein
MHPSFALLTVLMLTAVAADAQLAKAGAPAPVGARGCEPSASLSYICGPVASEDLVRIPHTDWLIASGMNVGQPAHLYLIDTVRKSASIVFPIAAPTATLDPKRASGCPGPPDLARMSTDGLALRAGAGAVHTLYAANHGDRMAIEFFAVDDRGAKPALRWVGCAPLPGGTLPNAVAVLPDGGLLVISFYDPRDKTAWTRMAAGKATGHILEWHANRGFADVANSATSGGNGIEISADGNEIYASSWSSRELIVLSRHDGSRRAIPLSFMPDNIHRLSDGSLLIGGQRTSVAAIAACTGAQCPQPWVIARVLPRTGHIQQLVTGTGSSAIAYACGAVALHGTLYITARGDQRIAYRALAARPYLNE